MEAKKEKPEVNSATVRSVGPGPSTSTNATAVAASQGSEGDHVKQELLPAPSLKRPREVEDWLLHPPDGSVSRYVIVVCVRTLQVSQRGGRAASGSKRSPVKYLRMYIGS